MLNRFTIEVIDIDNAGDYETVFSGELKKDLLEVYHVDADLLWEALHKHHNKPRYIKVTVNK